MPAGKHDFVVEKGATFRRTITWKDRNGRPIDLTGFIARLQAREDYDSAEAVINLVTDDGIELETPLTDGKFSLYISSEDTAAITAPSLRYDLELESPDGDVTRLLEGKIKVKREVTRDA